MHTLGLGVLGFWTSDVPLHQGFCFVGGHVSTALDSTARACVGRHAVRGGDRVARGRVSVEPLEQGATGGGGVLAGTGGRGSG